MIKNILFDLGGVIMTLSHPDGVKRFKELGVKDAEKQLDPYTQTGIFGDLEEGKITAEEWWGVRCPSLNASIAGWATGPTSPKGTLKR